MDYKSRMDKNRRIIQERRMDQERRMYQEKRMNQERRVTPVYKLHHPCRYNMYCMYSPSYYPVMLTSVESTQHVLCIKCSLARSQWGGSGEKDGSEEKGG